jgi:hypothetical protein
MPASIPTAQRTGVARPLFCGQRGSGLIGGRKKPTDAAACPRKSYSWRERVLLGNYLEIDAMKSSENTPALTPSRITYPDRFLKVERTHNRLRIFPPRESHFLMVQALYERAFSPSLGAV